MPVKSPASQPESGVRSSAA